MYPNVKKMQQGCFIAATVHEFNIDITTANTSSNRKLQMVTHQHHANFLLFLLDFVATLRLVRVGVFKI